MTKKNKRILIIDDDEVIRDGCCQVLSRKGYPVESTGDALRGLEMALRDVYDVILLDIRMPRMDGMEILKRLKGERGHIGKGHHHHRSRKRAAGGRGNAAGRL